MVAIPVLIVLPAEEKLQASARSAAGTVTRGHPGRAGLDPELSERLPPGVALDTTFAAVPLGKGRSTAERARSMATDGDEQYLVLGHLDSGRIADYAEHREGEAKIFANPQIGAMPICPGDPALGTAADVRGLLNVGELSRRGLSGDGVALAIVDTGINLEHLRKRGLSARLDPFIHWSPTPNVKPGEYPVDHGTMCAYCASIAAPEATLLDFPVLLSSRPGGSVMDGFLSDAVQAFSTLLTMMRMPEDLRPYHSLVVNNSWGMFHESWDFPAGHPGRYGDNPDHPFNQIVGGLAQAGADVIFAAGNCGSDCPDRRCQGSTTNVITGANSHPDVLCVAGVDVTDLRVGYSSKGPGNPNLAAEKPDVAAYTHFVGSEAYGAGSADGGTSTACPVAAGCIAAIRTKVSPSSVPPAQLFQAVRDTARKPAGPPGWDVDTGFGIIQTGASANAVMPSV